MQSLKNTIDLVIAQFRELGVAARLLIASLAVIVLMALILVAAFSGRTDMRPLAVNASMTDADRVRAVELLRRYSIPVDVRGQEIFVPETQHGSVLGLLTSHEVVRGDQIDFNSMLSDDSPFTDRETRRTRMLVAKQNEVARMISGFAGVRSARVVYSADDAGRGFGSAQIEPTASVQVQPRDAELPRATADAIARFVAGTHPNLKVRNVTVIDARNGRTMVVRSDEDLTADRHLDLTRQHERHMEEKIRDVLSIPGLRVAVTAVVDSDRVEERRTMFDEPRQGVLSERSNEFESTGGSGPRESGVRPNTGMSVSPPLNTGAQVRRAEARTDMQAAFGNVQSHTRRNGGVPQRYNVTVLVPYAHLAEMFNIAGNGEDVEVDAQEFQLRLDDYRRRLTDNIRPLVDLGGGEESEPRIVVDVFRDIDLARGGAGGASIELVSGSRMVGGGSDGTVRTVVLGVLALVSVVLMFMVVRRAGRTEPMPTAEELVGVPPVLTDEDSQFIGEADESVTALEGIEVDESQVRRQQMLEQINQLAVDNPDEAASLVRRWLREDGG